MQAAVDKDVTEIGNSTETSTQIFKYFIISSHNKLVKDSNEYLTPVMNFSRCQSSILLSFCKNAYIALLD